MEHFAAKKAKYFFFLRRKSKAESCNGFANFLCRLIREFSLTSFTSSATPFSWSQRGFSHLKQLFSSAPVLAHPNPSGQLILHLEDSDLGVGVVFTARSKVSPMRLLLFMSRPGWRNNDVGNRELLAVVPPLPSAGPEKFFEFGCSTLTRLNQDCYLV